MKSKLLKIGIALAVILIILLGFLPQIASTRLGKPLFVRAFEKKTHAHVTSGSLKCSWFGPQVFRNVTFERDSATGSFEELSIRAPFWNFTGAFQLKGGHIAYRGGHVEQIEGRIEGHDFTLTGVTLQGHISLKGQIVSKLQFHVQIDVTQFPLVAIDPRLPLLLGPTLDLVGTATMKEGTGTLDLHAASANLQTQLKGTLTEEGIGLSEQLVVSLRLTPEISALLLKETNPLFVTGLSAQNPVILRVEPEGFFFPFSCSLEKLKVGLATLDLGKMRCQMGETLKSVIALLNANRLLNASEMNIWAAPFSMHIEQGVLTAGRFDALLDDSIHICTWGSIDLIRDRLDMFLGLPA
ncbi:MAG: hypothetical protein KGQ49_07245, partial [Verrucomicrobia bacterium]|nr:hypothetical protein [Verrucomicrobiota bacterium]